MLPSGHLRYGKSFVPFFRFWLAPIPLIKHPGAASVDITGCNPNGSRAWRANPLPSYPHISRTIPTLVSANPYISCSGSESNYSNSDRRRWSNADHSLRASDYSPEQQHSAKSKASEIHFMISFSKPLPAIKRGMRQAYAHIWSW